jgi:hypothetical protein
MLSAFGGVVDVNLLMAYANVKSELILHYGFTDSKNFPGFTLSFFEVPVDWISLTANISTTLWQQPHLQQFDAERTDNVVDFNVDLNYRYSPLLVYNFGINAKTAGWIPGQVSLDKQVSIFGGLKFNLGQL